MLLIHGVRKSREAEKKNVKTKREERKAGVENKIKKTGTGGR